jgi:hypothetical protein
VKTPTPIMFATTSAAALHGPMRRRLEGAAPELGA